MLNSPDRAAADSGSDAAATAVEATLPHQMYAEIREKIMSGVYPAGMRLRERDLAEEFNVSRVPLREALPQLARDGFIEFLPRRGAVVTQLSLRDVDELFDMRLTLEPFAAQRAAESVLAGGDIGKLASTMAMTERAVVEYDSVGLPALNAQFHMDIVELADNRLLLSTMRSMMGRIQWLFRLTWHHNPSVSCTAHQQLFEAINDGNGRLASALAFAHIEHGRAPTNELLSHTLPRDLG